MVSNVYEHLIRGRGRRVVFLSVSESETESSVLTDVEELDVLDLDLDDWDLGAVELVPEGNQ